MSFPYDGSSYYVESDNTYHFNVIVPYSTYNYRVEVISPVLPLVEETVVLPIVKLEDVKKWVNSLEGVVDDVNSTMYPLFLLVRDIGRSVISYDLCGSKNAYKRAVSYYVGHYMELHLRAVKDQQNRMTMTPQIKNEIDTETEQKISMIDTHYGDFKQTLWGIMFWSIYGKVAQFDLGYYPY